MMDSRRDRLLTCNQTAPRAYKPNKFGLIAGQLVRLRNKEDERKVHGEGGNSMYVSIRRQGWGRENKRTVPTMPCLALARSKLLGVRSRFGRIAGGFEFRHRHHPLLSPSRGGRFWPRSMVATYEQVGFFPNPTKRHREASVPRAYPLWTHSRCQRQLPNKSHGENH